MALSLSAAINSFDDTVLAGKRIGLLTNMAARDSAGLTTFQRLSHADGVTIACLFTPEHGFDVSFGPSDPVPDSNNKTTPIVTLYGERLAPEPHHLDAIDQLVIDLPGLGVRCFTYLATALRAFRAASAASIPTLLLDRPNWLGRTIELPIGKVRKEGLLCPMAVPLRHGMTLGELLSLAANEERLEPPEIAQCAHGQNEWHPPSPNLPALQSAQLYPGTVLIEGTCLSEGRGTIAPFQNIGAPGLPSEQLAEHLQSLGLQGISVEPATFRPSTSKHAGTPCNGVHFSITDAEAARPVGLALALMAWVRDHYPDMLAPTPMLDALAGTPALREWCATLNSPVEALTANWHSLAAEFEHRRQPTLLY